jgi:hypothetical protein
LTNNRTSGGEVSRSILKTYQHRLKESHAFASRLEDVSRKLEKLNMGTQAQAVGRLAGKLRSPEV